MSAILAAMQQVKRITSREIGEAIKRRRKEIGLSQERLAEILDVSYQQVQRYENGTNKLNTENIQSIAAALSVPITFFFSTGYEQTVAEPSPPYMSAEEKTLLKYFRKIKDKNDKQMIINVTRLAAKKP
jgi:transcriptional regulator with XRE-family HTH domain